MNTRANIKREFARMAMTLTCGQCSHKWIERNSTIRKNGSVRCSHCGHVATVDMQQLEKEFVEATMKGIVNKLPKNRGRR